MRDIFVVRAKDPNNSVIGGIADILQKGLNEQFSAHWDEFVRLSGCMMAAEAFYGEDSQQFKDAEAEFRVWGDKLALGLQKTFEKP